METAVEHTMTPKPDKPEPTMWERFRKVFKGHPMAIAGLIGVTLFILTAVFAPFIAPQNPYDLAKLDILDGFDTVKICTGYLHNGVPVIDYPDQYDVLETIEPVYEELPGWNTAINEMREPGKLPDAAKRFIEVVEREVGIPVNVVGVGAEREDYLLWGTE